MKHLINFRIIIFVFVLMILVIITAKNFLYKTNFIYNLKTKENYISYYIDEPNVSIKGDGMVGIWEINPKYTNKINLIAWQRILKTAGIPYKLCSNFIDCSNFGIVILVGNMDKILELSKEEEKYVKEFVKQGGCIISDSVFTLKYGMLKDLFGYKDYIPSKFRKKLYFDRNYTNPYLDTHEERELILSNDKESIWTNGIILGSAKPIAYFEDGKPAITVNNFGKGKAYLLGISVFDLTLRNFLNRDFKANRFYINNFEPLSDIIVFFLKNIYENKFPNGITLHTAPFGYKASLVITHELDSSDAAQNITKFTEIERKLGVKSTIFVQTKYQQDYYDKPFFNKELINILKTLDKLGFEIGSHTVSHTKILHNLPFGSCNESYPEYKPKVEEKYTVSGNPTLCGELKVSKDLLEGEDIKILSFRSGHLEYHYDLPQAMIKLGYKFSSTFSAENVLTYFPYKLPYKDYSKESPIIEIPVALEDEKFPPLYFRKNSAFKLAEKIFNNGGAMVILIHPDLTFWKFKNFKILTFLEDFINSLPKNIWITTIRDLGKFWEKRDAVRFNYKILANKLIIFLYSPVEIEGLTFTKNSEYKIWSDHENILIKDKFIILKKIPKGFSKWVLNLS